LASLTAYLIGQLLDISIFGILRRLTGHRMLWLRSTGSTVLSQAIDSISVSFVFLVGTRPMHFIVSNAANNYVGKLIMAVLLTPLIYLGHTLFHRHIVFTEVEPRPVDEGRRSEFRPCLGVRSCCEPSFCR